RCRLSRWANNGLLRCTPLLMNPPGLRGGFEAQIQRRLRCLADAPEKGGRGWHNAADSLAPGSMPEVHSQRGVDDVVDCQPVEPTYDRLFLVQARCLVPRRDLGFDLRILRPSIRLLVVVGANVLLGRVGRGSNRIGLAQAPFGPNG